MSTLTCINCDKRRFESEAEVVEFFIKQFDNFGIERVESLLGIEFAFENGSYISEPPDDLKGEDLANWESQDVNYNLWRHNASNNSVWFGSPGLPMCYPAILVYSLSGHDGGKEFLNYAWVTLQDLNP